MGETRAEGAQKFSVWGMHWEGVPPDFAPDFGRGTPLFWMGFLGHPYLHYFGNLH